MCFSFFVPSAQHVADVIGRLVHGVLRLVRCVLRTAPHRRIHHRARRHHGDDRARDRTGRNA